MDLHVDDDAFVRAPVAAVYPRLTDIAGWSDWWPGVRTVAVAEGRTTAPPDEPSERWSIALRARRTSRPLRVTGTPGQYRHDAGFRIDLEGDLAGWSEFWLEDAFGGTVVHHLLVAATDHRRPVRVLRDYRVVLRRGLWRLKDDLQREARRDLGMAP
ncbi:MAG: hypothetical protein KY457_11460 [Actinobacteria bacterium]|nr:hypothetical protein [Actinomycetota bacterium]